MTPGRILYLLRREMERGAGASWHFHRTRPKITSWRQSELPAAPPVAVHTLTGSGDWLLCLWMLASWQIATGKTWQIVIHEDGTLGDEEKATIREIFPQAELVNPLLVASRMDEALRDYPACAEYRKSHPLARKIFDIPVLAGSREHLFILDSDVLFFQRPDELLRWAEERPAESWFNEDAKEGALISPAEASEKLDCALWPRVNSGLVALHRPSIDLAFCERALRETSLLEGHIWRVEQTLFALCASKAASGGLLPSTYEVSLGKNRHPDAVARHYVGAVRKHFYREGLPIVAKRLKLHA